MIEKFLFSRHALIFNIINIISCSLQYFGNHSCLSIQNIFSTIFRNVVF